MPFIHATRTRSPTWVCQMVCGHPVGQVSFLWIFRFLPHMLPQKSCHLIQVHTNTHTRTQARTHERIHTFEQNLCLVDVISLFYSCVISHNFAALIKHKITNSKEAQIIYYSCHNMQQNLLRRRNETKDMTMPIWIYMYVYSACSPRPLAEQDVSHVRLVVKNNRAYKK